jgi:hypothetical protein
LLAGIILVAAEALSCAPSLPASVRTKLLLLIERSTEAHIVIRAIHAVSLYEDLSEELLSRLHLLAAMENDEGAVVMACLVYARSRSITAGMKTRLERIR